MDPNGFSCMTASLIIHVWHHHLSLEVKQLTGCSTSGIGITSPTNLPCDSFLAEVDSMTIIELE